ncbi:MAG: glycosyltransferase family 4 protein [Anaerolineae bacterium]|nr:glycosyltransferase family 4 protein [Anaerolineae bacterium]MDQ7034790.1 glycosyltransferase family 4 protein [Anaerolineae bacterium]
MRVGFLAAEWQHNNGWAHYSTSLIQALQRQGIETQIITPRNTPLTELQSLHPLLPTVTPPDKHTLAQMAVQFSRIRSLLADCDIVHCTVEIYAPLAAAIATKRPLFTTIHGSYAHLPRIRRFPINRLYQWAFRQATLLCVSHYTEKVIQKIVPDSRTIVVNNGIDIERFAHLPVLENPPTRPTVITSGGVKARKGTLELVKAMAKVRGVLPDVQCIVMGSTSAEAHYVATVQQTIAELDLGDCVRLLGFVDENTLLAWYGAADVFVLPSMNNTWKFEGFGLATLEASAAGLPVIGTADCGAEDAIDHNRTGLLVNQANIDDELPQAIIHLLTDTADAKKMGQAGKEKAANQTWDFVADQMISVYKTQN